MRRPAELYPDVEFRDIRAYRIDGFLNIGQLAKALGVTPQSIVKYVKIGIFAPDFINRRGPFFSEARLEEIKAIWANRRTASPVSEPGKAVITPFGMMRPRVKPDEKVLERVSRMRRKRPSRDSSWKTRRHYNLKDLTP